MSFIYSKLTSFLNIINDEFHKSFLFTTIFSIIYFIEDKCVNSFFKGLYPGENFLSFLKKSYILKNHIFNPIIVLIVFAAFLSLSLTPIPWSLFETLIIAFLFFFIGAAILPRFFLNNMKNVIVFKRNCIFNNSWNLYFSQYLLKRFSR